MRICKISLEDKNSNFQKLMYLSTKLITKYNHFCKHETNTREWATSPSLNYSILRFCYEHSKQNASLGRCIVTIRR